MLAQFSGECEGILLQSIQSPLCVFLGGRLREHKEKQV